MKRILLLSLVLFLGFQAKSQQVIQEPPTTFFYSLRISGFNQTSDEASIKYVQAALKPSFDVIVRMNKTNGAFEITTSFLVEKSSVEQSLFNAGFELLSFQTTPNINAPLQKY